MAAEDVRPVQAEPAERKHRRRRCRRQGGASRTSSACAPTTRHPRRRKTDGQRPCRQRAHSKRACTQGQPGHRVPAAMKLYCFGWGRPASTDLRSNRTINCTSSVEVDTAHKEAHVAAKAAYARSSSQGGVQRRATFLLLDDVSAGLSTRRTDPRRRRARITFAAGLDWEGTKRASARFVLMRNFVSPGYSFLKRKRGEICIGARLPFPARCLVQVGLDSAYS